MKSIGTLFLIFSINLCFAQSEEITIPESTLVPMELTQELKEGKNKVGEVAKFVVSKDVVVDGAVVISKNTVVRASVTISKNRELRVDLSDVTAVDGSILKLSDCWIFTTAAQNLNSRGALLIKGTTKNCSTAVKTKIKKTNKQF